MILHKPSSLMEPLQTSDAFSVFLAGTIDNGNSVDWQTRVSEAISDYACNVYNPRRDNWVADMEQTVSNPQFTYQVNWEMDAIDEADLVFFYFAGGSVSPITLGELYWCLANDKSLIVVCDPSYWRRGNIEVMCSRSNRREVFDTLDEGIKILQTITEFHSSYPAYK